MQDPKTGTVETVAGVSRRRALVAVVATVFIELLGFGIIIPILLFYVRSFGASDVVYWSPFVLGAVLTVGIVAPLTTLQVAGTESASGAA